MQRLTCRNTYYKYISWYINIYIYIYVYIYVCVCVCVYVCLCFCVCVRAWSMTVSSNSSIATHMNSFCKKLINCAMNGYPFKIMSMTSWYQATYYDFLLWRKTVHSLNFSKTSFKRRVSLHNWILLKLRVQSVFNKRSNTAKFILERLFPETNRLSKSRYLLGHECAHWFKINNLIFGQCC